MYFDKEGKEIPTETWVELLGDPEYKIIEQTTWVGGDNNYMISTVWIGLNQNIGDGEPITFETMLMEMKAGGRDSNTTLLARYSNEQAAREGHARFVEGYAGKFV